MKRYILISLFALMATVLQAQTHRDYLIDLSDTGIQFSSSETPWRTDLAARDMYSLTYAKNTTQTADQIKSLVQNRLTQQGVSGVTVVGARGMMTLSLARSSYTRRITFRGINNSWYEVLQTDGTAPEAIYLFDCTFTSEDKNGIEQIPSTGRNVILTSSSTTNMLNLAQEQISKRNINWITVNTSQSSGQKVVLTIAPFVSSTTTPRMAYIYGKTSSSWAQIKQQPQAQFRITSSGSTIIVPGDRVGIGLSGSVFQHGLTYNLKRDANVQVQALSGTGNALTFNSVGVAGTYYVETSAGDRMDGTVVVSMEPFITNKSIKHNAASVTLDSNGGVLVIDCTKSGTASTSRLPQALQNLSNGLVNGWDKNYKISVLSEVGNTIKIQINYPPNMGTSPEIQKQEVIFNSASEALTFTQPGYGSLKTFRVSPGDYTDSSLSTFSVNLDGSQIQITYQLYKDNVLQKTMYGTGGAISFTGLTSNGIYTVKATYGGKTVDMIGSAVFESATPAASNKQNFVKSITYTAAGSVSSYADVTYMDGFGNPLQTINVKAGGNDGTPKSIVTPYYYDPIRRETRSYLPYATPSGDGYYESSQFSRQRGYYNSRYPGESQYAYTENVLEASELNRVKESYNAGKVFRNGTGIKTVMSYGSNATNDVVRLEINGATGFKGSGTYTAGTLMRQQVTDEDGVVVITFTDKQDRLILERRLQDSYVKHDTYYVYDDRGNLRYVLPPMITASPGGTYTDNTESIVNYGYVYKYDYRDRLIERRLPGAGWEHFVYDRTDRLVLSQDANMRANSNRWIHTLYDAMGRAVKTELITFAAARNRAALETLYKNAVNLTFTEAKTVLSETYYDSYPAGVAASVANDFSQYPQGDTKGLKTHEKIAQIQATGTIGQMVERSYYYDAKGRPILTVEKNHLGGTSRYSMEYDFIDNVKRAQESHKPTTTAAADILLTTYAYDARGRLITETTTLNGAGKAVVKHSYDELGQLTKKTYGEGTGAVTEDYAYNIQGWLTGKSSDYYEMMLRYYNKQKSATVAKYTGNITEWEWSHKDKGSSGGGTTISTSYPVHSNVLAIPVEGQTAFEEKTRSYSMDRSFPHYMLPDGKVRPEYLIKQTSTHIFYYIPLEGGATSFFSSMIGILVAPQVDISDPRIADVPKKTAIVITTESTSTGPGVISNYTYAFKYDNMGRLTDSDLYEKASATPVSKFVEKGLTYDLNGNIKTLKRYSSAGALADNFTYNYTGNQLTSLSGSHSATYTYDTNGNMTKDGLENVTLGYNFLNLVGEVKSGTALKAQYRWLADGSKAGVNTNAANTGDGYEYLGSLVYTRKAGALALESAAFGGGRIIKGTSYSPNYFITDHLGSTRVVVDGSGNIQGRHDYLPFGQAWQNPAMQTGTNRYLYNGKEAQTTGGLSYLDFGARFYSARHGRWFNLDPKAESFYWMSPYTYVGNNPLIYIDPDGRRRFKINVSVSINQGKAGVSGNIGGLGLGYQHSFAGGETTFGAYVAYDTKQGRAGVGAEAAYSQIHEETSWSLGPYGAKSVVEKSTQLDANTLDGGSITHDSKFTLNESGNFSIFSANDSGRIEIELIGVGVSFYILGMDLKLSLVMEDGKKKKPSKMDRKIMENLTDIINREKEKEKAKRKGEQISIGDEDEDIEE